MFSRRYLNFWEHSGNSRHRWDDNSKIYVKIKVRDWRLAKNFVPVSQSTLHLILKDYNLKPLKAQWSLYVPPD